ncbi:MAG: HU domain-containing protein [Bacteroidia bacterium]
MEKYISELLFEHDCVLIPALGGFIARSTSSCFAKTGSVLLPPSKSIVFNKNLSTNDGLLAGYIMQKEDVTYQQANTIIENFVAHGKLQLEIQKRFEINGLGVLYKNAENTILFEQDSRVNYNPNAFGLPAVSAIKLIAEEKVVVPKPDLQYRTITPTKQPKTVRRIAIAVSVAVLVIAVVLISTNQNHFQDVLATFNPFGTHSKTVIAKNKEKISDKPTVTPDTVSVDKTNVVKPTKLVEEWDKQPYQIVVGCFAVKQNAFNLISQLGQQNIGGSIVGQNAKNLFIVSIAGYTDKNQARKKLVEIKAQYPTAWVYKR